MAVRPDGKATGVSVAWSLRVLPIAIGAVWAHVRL